MSAYKPSGYNIPSNIITLEQAITHHILVASRIYRGQKILEDDGVLRPVVEYFPFHAGDNTSRFGFRGSFEIDAAWTAGNAEGKDFWEYIIEHDNVGLPVAYFDAI